MPPLSDAVLAAIIASLVTALGYLLTRRTEREQMTITVMQAQISQLWDRVQAQETRIDRLVKERQHERARSWAAIEYARALIAHIEMLSMLLPKETSVPAMPPVPEELDEDL